MTDEELTLANEADAWNFTHGMPMELSFPDGRPLTFWRRIGRRLARRWQRATRWFRPRSVVTHVWLGSGQIQLGTERWSWRRWRWERR